MFATGLATGFKFVADLRKETIQERRKMWVEIAENKSRTLLNAARGDDHAKAIERLVVKLDHMGDKIDTRISEIPTRIVEMLNARKGG